MDFLDNLSFKYEKSINQTKTFTAHHVRYDITFTRIDNKEKLCFEYQCNPRYCKPGVDECLWCIVEDAQSYETCGDDISAFQQEFGYTDAAECIAAFNGCKENYQKLMAWCGHDIYQQLAKYYEEEF